jgi:hypothetical protein
MGTCRFVHSRIVTVVLIHDAKASHPAAFSRRSFGVEWIEAEAVVELEFGNFYFRWTTSSKRTMKRGKHPPANHSTFDLSMQGLSLQSRSDGTHSFRELSTIQGIHFFS